MGTIYRPLVQLNCCTCKLQNMNLHAFKIRSEFCKQFRPRLDTTELLIYTRGESTMGAKRLVGRNDQGGNDQGGNVLGAKRLEEETVWGRNVPDSFGLTNRKFIPFILFWKFTNFEV